MTFIIFESFLPLHGQFSFTKRFSVLFESEKIHATGQIIGKNGENAIVHNFIFDLPSPRIVKNEHHFPVERFGGLDFKSHQI